MYNLIKSLGSRFPVPAMVPANPAIMHGSRMSANPGRTMNGVRVEAAEEAKRSPLPTLAQVSYAICVYGKKMSKFSQAKLARKAVERSENEAVLVTVLSSFHTLTLAPTMFLFSEISSRRSESMSIPPDCLVGE